LIEAEMLFVLEGLHGAFKNADESICAELRGSLGYAVDAMPSALASVACFVFRRAQLVIGAHGQAMLLGST
jgi:hypothetical protein